LQLNLVLAYCLGIELWILKSIWTYIEFGLLLSSLDIELETELRRRLVKALLKSQISNFGICESYCHPCSERTLIETTIKPKNPTYSIFLGAS
jgi:hypothetical protein